MDHACNHKDREGKAQQLDQFYTDDRAAEKMFECFQKHYAGRTFDFIEPSAGRGAFLKLLPENSIGYDIDPKWSGVIRKDFLEVDLVRTGKIAIIGNPPFGKNCSLAVKFFNRAAEFAEVIAFILPPTFQKWSMQDRLDLNFHLVLECEVPDNAFWFENKRKDVPTVFQIWERRDESRERPKRPKSHPHFSFLKTAKGAEFAITRAGGKAGSIHRDFSKSPSSNYFIKCHVDGVQEIMQSLDFSRFARLTAGQKSLSKAEIFHLYCSKESVHTPQRSHLHQVTL